MKIKWYGQASFLITSDSGLSVVTDPYPPEEAGYRAVEELPDFVVMSSATDNFHCRADKIPGNPIVVNALDVAQNGGVRSEKGLAIHAIEAMEALDHRFHDPDQNALYRFDIDGISIGHMGDVGNPLSDDQMAFYEGVDVLLALAGGHPTIELDDLWTVIQRVQPKLVIPMHFRTLRYKPRNILWIQSLVDYFNADDVEFACEAEVMLNKSDLPDKTRMLVLAYA